MKTKSGFYFKGFPASARIALPFFFLLIISLVLLSTAQWWETGNTPSLDYHFVSFVFVSSLTVSLIAGLYYFLGYFKMFGNLSWLAKVAWTCCALVLLAGLLMYLYFNPEYKGPLSHAIGSFTLLMFLGSFFVGPIGFLALIVCFAKKIDWYLAPLVGCYILGALVWFWLLKISMGV